MQERLEKKASVYRYGETMREFADIRLSLNPLIDKKSTLERFIGQVNKAEINELNAKDFNMKIEQMNFRIKDAAAKHEQEVKSVAARVTPLENAITALQEELVEVKMAANRAEKKNSNTTVHYVAQPRKTDESDIDVTPKKS